MLAWVSEHEQNKMTARITQSTPFLCLHFARRVV